ncbi:MAG: hypothetical protein M3N26_02365 [Pseudomonadota bacterium]|nr:hypothetical protein [Pseudomonadota bacterium]
MSDLKRREAAARRIAASVKEAVARIMSDPAVGDQVVSADDPQPAPKN